MSDTMILLIGVAIGLWVGSMVQEHFGGKGGE